MVKPNESDDALCTLAHQVEILTAERDALKVEAKRYQWLMTTRRTEQHNRASFLLHEGRITEAAMEIVAAMKAAS